MTLELDDDGPHARVDAARIMMTIAIDANGNRDLVAMAPGTESAGASAQLSTRGLDRLEPTQADTLPYPIVPAGTQPRLSQSAIAVSEHTAPVITVPFDDLSPEDLAYWTEPNPTPNQSEFAGYLAYQDILGAARTSNNVLELFLQACNSTPNPAACKQALHITYCVDDPPDPEDFRIRIDGMKSYFDPARTEDALVIGDVTGMDLSFGTNQILADFTLENIQGWLEASIDPANIYIEWDQSIFDLCTIKPAARPLSDFLPGAVDREDWLTCHDLSFSAGSGTLGDPVAFDIVADVEQIRTPFNPGTPDVSLASVSTDLGAGICSEPWLAATMTTELLGWQSAVETTIANELVTSPGEDEALDRLVSPYELGVTWIETPPPGTPPYRSGTGLPDHP